MKLYSLTIFDLSKKYWNTKNVYNDNGGQIHKKNSCALDFGQK